MIQHRTHNWQRELKDSFRKVDELLNFLTIDPKSLIREVDSKSTFNFLVPRHFASLMQQGNIDDPLLKQVLPLKRENVSQPLHFVNDPLQESDTNTQSGLIHKYHGRVLLLVSGHCAINCRYCFRRHFPYDSNQLSKHQWLHLLQQIANDTSISEIILSGGDPLIASDQFLKWLIEQIASMPGIQRLRIHSRLPVVMPNRITEEAIHWMAHNNLITTLVLHTNHPNEISNELSTKIQLLNQNNVKTFNQGVLLRGINDDVQTLETLSVKLYQAGIIPYYMFQLDPVTSTAHFEIPERQIKLLQQQLWARLPGYLMPRFSVELPNQPGKLPV